MAQAQEQASFALFEAFFWMQAYRADENSPYQPKVIWHSPNDVSHITKEHRDIPSFCFPDLNRLQMEKPAESASEYFVFTLQSADGIRYYGFCYRHLFRGIARRFDVGRRTRHCLCIISRYPHFAFFKSLLMHIYGAALLERYLGQCKGYTQTLLKQLGDMITNDISHFPIPEPGLLQTTSPLVNDARALTMIPTVQWSLPRAARTPYRDVNLLPLLDRLGVEKFFKVFSSALCERRILFVADDINLLSTTVLSAAAILHPFSWTHIFITVLPHKLLRLVTTASPYLIGIKRQSYGALKPDQLEGVVVVDLDRGEVTPHGDCPTKDLLGDAGTALKQASEGFDRMKAGLTSLLTGSKSASTDSKDDTPSGRDLMAMLVLDLKTVLASKPGSVSLQSVASGLLRGLPGTAKTVAESKAQWALEAEKVLRDALATFFVFLFADLDEFLLPETGSYITEIAASTQSSRAHNEVRSRLDFRGFMSRKKNNGSSKLLLDFLMEFLHAQMFEDYCTAKLRRPSSVHRASRAASAASTTSTGSAEGLEDAFSAACSEISTRGLINTATNAKQCVLMRSSSFAAGEASQTDAWTAGASTTSSAAPTKIYTAQFHAATLQFTQGTSSGDVDLLSLFSSPEADPQAFTSMKTHQRSATSQTAGLLERVVTDSFHAFHQRKVFSTLHYRLQTCLAANCKGPAGLAGCKALIVLQTLLIQGQLSAITSGLDLLPLLCSFLRINPNKVSSSVSALDFLAGQFFDPRPLAWATYELLVDHKRLLVQRMHFSVTKAVESFKRQAISGRSMSAGVPAAQFVLQPDGSKRFPSFADLHNQFNDQRMPSLFPGHLRCSEPERVRAEREEGQDDGEESMTAVTNLPAARTETAAVPTQGPGAVAAVAPAPPARFAVHMKPSVPTPSSAVMPPAEVDLLDLNGVLLDDNAKYRALNKDTGEVLDLRVFEEKNLPLPFPYNTPTTVAPSSVLKLKPPPNDKGPRRRPGGVTEGSLSPKSSSSDFSDFFASSPKAVTPAPTAPAAPAAPMFTPTSAPVSSQNTAWASSMGTGMGYGAPGPAPMIMTQRPAGATPRGPAAAPSDPFASLVNFK